MRLLLKWLRPKVVPSPRRKKIPFGIRVQLYLYRSCIKKLTKGIAGMLFPIALLLLERRQPELPTSIVITPLKQRLNLHLQIPDGMVERAGATSHLPDKRRNRRYFNCFHLEDHFLIEIDGRKISIDHGQGRSFVSTFKGRLKESDNGSLFAKYAFSGSIRGNKVGMSGPASSISGSYGGKATSEVNSLNRTASDSQPVESFSPKRRTRGLFGDDPLFDKKTDAPEAPLSTQSPSIKSVEGVTIDESF